MMAKEFMVVHDITTGQVTEIELTEEQIVLRNAEAKAENDATILQQKLRETALEKLANIGLTVEDLTALGLKV